MKAMPITPWATARMVATDSTVNSLAAFGADDAREDRPAGAIAGLAEGHHDAGDDEGGDELQDAAADAGHHRQRRLGQVTDLRLQALDQRRQVGRAPVANTAWIFSPDHAAIRRRPACGGGICSVFCCTSSISRCTESPSEFTSTAVGTTISATPSSVISVAAQPLPPAHPGGQRLVQRIQRDGQDQRPDHQHQEGREDPVAQHHQGQDQAGANQHVEQAGVRPASRRRDRLSWDRSWSFAPSALATPHESPTCVSVGSLRVAGSSAGPRPGV